MRAEPPSGNPMDGPERLPVFSFRGRKSGFCPACHCVKFELTTTFSGSLSPSLQNEDAESSEAQGRSSLWHPVGNRPVQGPTKSEPWSVSRRCTTVSAALLQCVLRCFGCRPVS